MKISTRISPPRSSQHQRGATLLLALLFVVLGLATLVTLRADRKGPEMAAERKTALALAQAKEALLGNSATNNIATGIENPGRLPCPNVNNTSSAEGSSAGLSGPNCASAGTGIPQNMGRFPWKSLRVADLRDGASERLWYVIDPAFVDTGAAMNSGISPTPLTVNSLNQVVAVIIAPGAALGALNQQRDAASQDDYRNYLESYMGALAIVRNVPSAIYNDHMITITAREVFSVATQRIIGEFAKMSDLIAPYPATLSMVVSRPMVWMNNQWDAAVTNYTVSATSSTGDTLTLQFANCASVFTIQWDGTRNQVRRSGGC